MVQGTATTPAARVLSISLGVGNCQQIFDNSDCEIVYYDTPTNSFLYLVCPSESPHYFYMQNGRWRICFRHRPYGCVFATWFYFAEDFLLFSNTIVPAIPAPDTKSNAIQSAKLLLSPVLEETMFVGLVGSVGVTGSVGLVGSVGVTGSVGSVASVVALIVKVVVAVPF